MYVVAPSLGDMLGPPDDMLGAHHPMKFIRGDSMIVDFDGVIKCYADYTGETTTGAVIDIEHLRKRRADPWMNCLTMLRTEALREIYTKPIYPKNIFLTGSPTAVKDRMGMQPVEKFLKERIFIPPSY